MSNRLSECCCTPESICTCTCKTGKWPGSVAITVNMPDWYCTHCKCDYGGANKVNFSGSAIAYLCCYQYSDGTFDIGYQTNRMGPIPLCEDYFGSINYNVWWQYFVGARCLGGPYGHQNWTISVLSGEAHGAVFPGCIGAVIGDNPADCNGPPLLCLGSSQGNAGRACFPQIVFRSDRIIPPCRSPVGLSGSSETFPTPFWQCTGRDIPSAPMSAYVS